MSDNYLLIFRYFICQCSDNICWCSDKQKMGKVGKSICKQFWWIITDNICKTSQFICEKLPKMEKKYLCALTDFCLKRLAINLRRLPAEFAAGFAAGTRWICGRYLLDLRRVPVDFAAGTCWICGRYLTGYKYGNVYFLVQKFFLFLNLINIYSNIPDSGHVTRGDNY